MGEKTEPTEIMRVRVGQAMKWAPMLGQDVPDRNTGIDLILLSDGTVRWEDPFARADREEPT